jgi:hypothetical protein
MVRFNGASYVTFAYDRARHGWLLTQNGRAMRLADGTVVAVGGPQPGAELRLILVPVNGMWRIAYILPAA